MRPPRGLRIENKNQNQKGELKIENTNSYVVVEVGFEGLFEAMVKQAEKDMTRKNARLADDAKKGLADWLKVLTVLDIADAVIRY